MDVLGEERAGRRNACAKALRSEHRCPCAGDQWQLRTDTLPRVGESLPGSGIHLCEVLENSLARTFFSFLIISRFKKDPLKREVKKQKSRVQHPSGRILSTVPPRPPHPPPFALESPPTLGGRAAK